MLIMPTIQEIQKENINEVSRRLKADEKLATKNEPKAENKKPVTTQNKIDEINNQKQEQVKNDKNTQQIEAQDAENKPPLLNNNTNIKEEIDTSVIASIIQEKMDSTNQYINKLVENNHVLKIRMSEIQDELASVREKLAEGEPLNKEIKQFLDNERLRQEEKKNEESGIFRKLLDNAWLLLALAFLPALLIIGGVYFFLRWKNKTEQENTVKEALVSEKTDSSDETITQSAPIILDLEDDDEEIDLNLDIDANELFTKEMPSQNNTDENVIDETKEVPSSVVNHEIDNDTEQVQQEIKTNDYAQLNALAKQAEDYVDSVEAQPNAIQASDSINENEDFLKDLEFIHKDKNEAEEGSFDTFLDEMSDSQKESDAQILTQDTDEEIQVEKESEKEEAAIKHQESSEEFIDPFDDVNLTSLSFPRVDEIDLDELGEFEEDDAFDAALAEQKELEEYALEKQTDDKKLLRAEDEAQLVAGLDMESLLSSDYDDDFSNAKETSNEQAIQTTSIAENVEGFEKEFEDLDLAKAFIEMNDAEAALPLLTDLSISENKEVAKEAKKLLSTLKND